MMTPGTRLGPYEILGSLGAGGMGEVYRARDTRLDRVVAVKILPAALAADPQLRERFEREARAISQLTHPHICTLHDIGRDGAVDYLVLEYLEGETLEHRLEAGALPLDLALRIGIEVAQALVAAHRAGIVHRDLKPGNIMLAKSGAARSGSPHAKLLDFGLAKRAAPVVAGSSASMLPTTPPNLTAQGTILGTFQYMAPEQIEGVEADARTDIFAFGCVLYEMVTGRKAFDGKTRASLIGSILKDTPPPVSQVVAVAPRALDRLIAACMEKDPDERLQSAHDVLVQLRWIGESAADAAASAPASRAGGARASWAIVAVVAGAAALLAGAAGWIFKPQPTSPRGMTRFSIGLPGDQSPTASGRHVMAISPDGTRLVYVANQQLYVRVMDQLEPLPVRGTQENPSEPFFSPDGEWIGYFARNKLKKVAAKGGAPVSLCDALAPTGASWADDRIVFGQQSRGIFEESPAGGAPRLLIAPDKNRKEALHGPQVLPGGDAVLFTSKEESAARWNTGRIVVQTLKDGARKTLVEGGTDGRYLTTGHLLYVRDGVLYANRFDRSRLTLTGGPVSMLDGVAETLSNQTGAAQFTVSLTGALVYLPGTGTQARTLVWRDRQGRETPIAAPPRAYGAPRLSPDGARIAVDARDQDNDIWVWDIARQILTRLTFGSAQEVVPLWTRDGRRILYSSNISGPFGIFWKPADNTGQPELLTRAPGQIVPQSLSADGRQLAFYAVSDSRLLLLELEGKRTSRTLTPDAPFNERNPEISQDGRWIAYESNESGTYEIYVRPFPSVEQGRWQLSTDGGTRPRWAPNGRELFYVSNNRRLMVVSIQAGATFTSGKPEVLFEDVGAQPSPNRHYDVTPDGARFVIIKEPQSTETAGIVVVENWLEELNARVPIGK